MTGRPDPHSVEHFAERMRQVAHMWSDVRPLALKYIEVYAVDAPAERGTRADDMQAIRNIIAAAEIVNAELEAAKSAARLNVAWAAEHQPGH